MAIVASGLDRTLSWTIFCGVPGVLRKLWTPIYNLPRPPVNTINKHIRRESGNKGQNYVQTRVSPFSLNSIL